MPEPSEIERAFRGHIDQQWSEDDAASVEPRPLHHTIAEVLERVLHPFRSSDPQGRQEYPDDEIVIRVPYISRVWHRMHRRNRQVRLTLDLPQVFTLKGTRLMPNIELKSNTVQKIAITAVDGSGTTQPLPAGDTLTAVSSNPASLGVAIGTLDDGTTVALVLTPLVKASPGLTATVSDSAGSTPAVQAVDIVEGVALTLELNTAAAEVDPQTEPTAPGP